VISHYIMFCHNPLTNEDFLDLIYRHT
jgi:hypothetical protein